MTDGNGRTAVADIAVAPDNETTRRNRATNFIGRKMLPVIEKLSKEKGLSAVVYLNPTRDAYVDPSLIITEEVIKAYNAAYPVTGAAPAPAKKP